MPRDHFTNYRVTLFSFGAALMVAAFGAQVGGWSHFITIGFLYGSGLAIAFTAVWLIARAYYASDPLPLIRVSALIPASLQRDGLVWRRQYGGLPALVASVVNQPAIAKKVGSYARGVAASIQFEDYLGPQLYVRRGHWIDTLISTTDMPVGTERLLLIGMRNENLWAAFINEYETDPRSLPGNENVIFTSMPKRIPFNAAMKVTIRIYSEETGIVFDTCTFAIPESMDIVNRT